jgi:hypothetical protein
MLHKKLLKESDNGTHASVKKELAKPRMAKSARIAELNLETERVSEWPSTTMAGTVDKIISSRIRNKPERAQIIIDGPEKRYRSLRIENTLIDEYGDDVRLKKGAHVEVTVTTKDVNWRC